MSSTITLPVSIPQDVEGYCQSRGLLPDLYSAIRLAEEMYAPVKSWAIAIEPDPEIEDDYVVIDIAITGDLDEILRKQDAFTRSWSRVATTDGGWRIRVLWTTA